MIRNNITLNPIKHDFLRKKKLEKIETNLNITAKLKENSTGIEQEISTGNSLGE